MDPLQSLMEEHRVIERVLNALERFVDRVRTASMADQTILTLCGGAAPALRGAR